MSFWGVYLKPNEAYTVVHNQNDPKKLRITQATLGDAVRTSPARSTVNCSIGDKPEIAICSLIVPNLTCCQLELEFDESHDVIFSVKGPRGIHLAGYFVTPAADHLRVINYGNEVLNGDEVPEETQCGLLQENGDAIVKKKKEKKNKKKQASTIEPTASGYVSDTESEMLEARLTKQNGSTDALERSENKVKDKRKASTIEPTAIGNVSATEDNKFGSESRIINENGSSKALERGEDKEEKKNRKRKASTIEHTASGYVSPTEDDKFGSDSIIIKENGSTKALNRGEDKEEKKNRKKKASTKEPTASGYVSPTEDDKFGLDSIIIKENGSTKALERGEDKEEKKNRKRKARTIEPTAIGNVSATEDNKFGSESRIINENGSTKALERGEDKEEKKNRKRKACTIEPTAIGNVSATEDNKFGSESRIIKENGSTKALDRGEYKEEKKNRKKKASTKEPTASGYVSPTEDDKFGSNSIIIKENGSTKALERGEDKEEKKNRKRKASTIEPTAIGNVSATEDNKFGSESRIINENGSTKALERGEDKEEKKNRKRKASTIEPTASGYVSPTEDDKFGPDSIIIKENGSTKALERGEDKKEKKNTKRKARTIEPTASGYVSPTEDDKFGSESIIIKENGSSNALEKSEDTAEKKKKKKMRKKSRSKHNLSNDNNPSTGDRNGDSPSLTIEGQLPEMSKTILVECEVKGAGAKSK